MTDELPTALYRFFDADDVLLYVGIALSPAGRWKRHRGEKEWWYDIRRATIDWYDTRAEAEEAEASAISAERPLHNRMLRSYGEIEPGLEVMPIDEARKVLGHRVDLANTEGICTVLAKHGRNGAVIVPAEWYERVSAAYGDQATS